MTFHHDHGFIDIAEEADARRAARRVSVIGMLAALLLGSGLISLLMYGPILRDNDVVELTAPPAVTVPQAPTPQTPATP
ncbi:MAG TPA: hypothetical protein PKE16_15840 [Hyphomicrobium sp.]|nr:hypothetical protein [Hyphomicrobium sp.]